MAAGGEWRGPGTAVPAVAGFPSASLPCEASSIPKAAG